MASKRMRDLFWAWLETRGVDTVEADFYTQERMFSSSESWQFNLFETFLDSYKKFFKIFLNSGMHAVLETATRRRKTTKKMRNWKRIKLDNNNSQSCMR